MKKSTQWLQYSISFIVIVIVIVSIFNFKVDSLGIFGNANYLSKAAKDLTSGKMIAGLQNIDDRLFQDLIIKNLQVRSDVIVIGSSTSMKLRKEFLSNDGINFFNHSLSGASIEDYIAIVGAYEFLHGYLPSNIVFGVDPWVFNKNNGQGRWKGLKNYYDYELDNIYDVNLESDQSNFIINLIKYKQLVNFDYSISNLKFFIKTLLKSDSKKYDIVESIESDNFIRLSDGSIIYPFSVRHIKDEKVREYAIAFAQGKPYSLDKYDSLSKTKLFEDFVLYLKSNKVNVTFLLLPYNPITYDLLKGNEKYKYISIAEKYLINLANINGFKLRGSYSPHKFNLTNKDFFDGVHGRDSVYKKIFGFSL
tara:strand:+ start:3261 stop:4352 length:1092 start_codon:yes stop_codon:yes gene_type:complete